ncbi:hypothetical protein [Bacillus alkalicellulosilyticus]|uniref:hypothetical protein n=1 Tax=Alkalihalobacterium alkalicellulosilyticum TaxID=1912214 RepID=UPI00099701E3|nr:hypothetical protein [Bacillus alkalicellulosilyticus]
MNNGNTNGNMLFPFFGGSDNDGVTKSPHDSYDIYVNEEYIGKKTLLTQNEKVDDVLDFINRQGIKGVTAELQGDHFIIHPSENETEHVKDAISTYLQNR